MPEPKPIIPNPGSERDPRNFVGRADTTSRAMDMLKAKQSILLSDPRRMGKTFWMRTLEERLNKNDDYRAVFIDYQGVNSVEEFLTTTARALSGSRNLPDKFPERLAALFENIDASVSLGPLTLKEAVRSSSKTSIAVLEDILSQLDLDLEKDSKKAPLVVIMDEVSDAVLTIAKYSSENEANGLLKRLRHLRSSTKNIRWVIAGSIGFHHVLAAIEASTDVINDLNNLMFGPLSNTDAEYLARCLALGINRPISDEAVATVVAITDGFPSLIQTLFVMMKYEPDGSSTTEKAINAEEIRQKLDDFIDDRNHSQDVTHYVTRIDLYYGDSVDMAQSILDIMAQGTGSISFRDINEHIKDNMGSEFIQKQFITAYNNLCDDHYLIEKRTDDGYEVMWRYQILREIYIRRGKKF